MIESLQKAIAKAVHSLYGVEVVPQISLPEAEFGDFATNVAFQLAGRLKQDPKAIAGELSKSFKDELIDSIEVGGNGFINITMSSQFWISELAKVSPDFGRCQHGMGKKVQVEFISANPTGPTTFGNARGGFIGDVIARVLAYQGCEVTREYYFNNGGTQIRKLVESVKVAAGLDEASEVQYRGQYIDELAKEFADKLKTADETEAAGLLTQAILKQYIEPAVKKMHISFDEWFNEGELEPSGMIDKAMARLRQEALMYESDGAVWLASSKLGDERDRVLRKSNGDLTYLANDIAYHLNIFEVRGFDVAIKQWGADHAGQVPSLSLVMQKLTPDKRLDFNIHQWVRLVKEGHEVKMSKRAGSYVTVEDVIDELGDQGSDVTRFFMLMRSADTQLDFDLDLAKEHSQKNPLFYVLYSYVRAISIMTKATSKGLVPAQGISGLEKLEIQLVKKIAHFPSLIEQIGLDYGVHRLTFFGIELARLFHDYYESVRITSLPAEAATAKLYIIERYITFMKVYFAILGIEPIEKM